MKCASCNNKKTSKYAARLKVVLQAVLSATPFAKYSGDSFTFLHCYSVAIGDLQAVKVYRSTHAVAVIANLHRLWQLHFATPVSGPCNRQIRSMSHIRLHTVFSHGSSRFSRRCLARFWMLDTRQYCTVSYVSRPGARIETASKWHATRGKPGIDSV